MTATINTAGLAEIREFLATSHKRGARFTGAEISAWASEAEESADRLNGGAE